MSEEDKDTILVDRIRELENKLTDMESTNSNLRKKLYSPIRIVESFKNFWGWWWRSDDRQVLTVLGTLGIFGVVLSAWLIGGYPTDKFYIDTACACSIGKYGVFQKYDWGKDLKVESCESVDICATALEKHSSAWLKHKDKIGAP